MTIESPRVLMGFLILLPVIAVQVRAFLKGRAEITLLGTMWAHESTIRVYTVKWFFSSFAFDVFLIFAVLAAADITWGERPVEEDRSGLDVVIAVDISHSMLATDTAPSRLDRAIGVVRAMTRQLPSARMALVAFKGAAVTVTPLTEDANALEVVLDGVGPALVSAPGTNIEVGLNEALRSFPEASFAHRAIVVLSDGEALDGEADRPIGELRRRGIPVMTVLTGTSEGSTIPTADGTPVLDSDGRPAITRADPAALERIAARTGGTFFDVASPDVVTDLSGALSRFATVRQGEGFRLVPRRRYRLFLSVAIAALFASTAVRVVRWRGML